jgi:hypothetical protein
MALSGEVAFRLATTQVGYSRLGRLNAPISGNPEIGENASLKKVYR